MAAMALLIKAIPFVDRGDSKPPKWRNPLLRTTTTTQISLLPSSMIKNSSSTTAGFIRTIKCSSINNNRESDFRVQCVVNNSKKNGFSIKRPLLGFSQQDFRSNLVPTNRKPFFIGAEKGDGGAETNKEELKEAGKESSMFSKFSLKQFENSDPPLIWWLIGRFVVYRFATWRVVGGLKDFVGRVVGPAIGHVVEPAVKSVVVATVMTVVVPLLLVLSVVFYIFTDPMYALSSFIGTLSKIPCALYSVVVNSSFYPELSAIIFVTSVVLAIADATVPGSVKSQHNLLTMAGIVAFAFLNGIIPEPLVWVLVVASFCYSRYVKRRDDVSSALPSAAVLAAVGKPGLILFVMVSYITLGIYQQSKKLSEEDRKVELARTVRRRILVPLLAAALAIGTHVASKRVQYEQFAMFVWWYLTTSRLTWVRYKKLSNFPSMSISNLRRTWDRYFEFTRHDLERRNAIQVSSNIKL